jgi:DnaK suppressor protein
MENNLSPKQQKILQESLVCLREELEKNIESAMENTKPVELDKPIGRLTRIDEIQQQSMAKANRDANRQRLRLVEAALKRISSGDYGSCRSCGEAIGWARLQARPESALCRECQEEQENR